MFTVPWVQEVLSRQAWREDLSAEGRQRAAKPRKKPLAKSAFIYRAGWTLTLPLKCQSQLWFPTRITSTGTWRNGRSAWIPITVTKLSNAAVISCSRGLPKWFSGSQNNSPEKGSACEFGVLVQNMWITGSCEWVFLQSSCG